MFVDWLLASLHHLAVFSLAAILSAEIFLTAGPIDDRLVLRVARVDAWFGILAALVVAAGVLRVVFGAKGYEYYYVNIFFWAKMALFVGVGLVSVAPTMLYIGWRRRVRADPSFRPQRTRSNNCARPSMSRRVYSPSFRFAPRRSRAVTGCEGG
jgi:putative membrane protein